MRYFLFIALLLAAFAAHAEEKETRRCSADQYVCVTATQGDSRIVFRAQNNVAMPLTVTVSVESENMWVSREGPLTFSLFGEENQKLFELAVFDPELAWSYSFDFVYMAGSTAAMHDDSYIYRLPYEKSRAFKVVANQSGTFSQYEDGQYGVSFNLPVGATVLAAREGRVVEVVDDFAREGPDSPLKQRGNYILIEHGDGTLGRYSHLDTHGSLVKIGDTVSRGQPIARSGHTGFSEKPLLHFDVFTAADARRIRTVPIQFETAQGVVKRLEVGKAYTAN